MPLPAGTAELRSRQPHFEKPQSRQTSHPSFIWVLKLPQVGQALAAGLPSLNICLGAQLLADALGAEVAPHPEGKAAWGGYEVSPLEAPENPVPRGLTSLAGNLQGFGIPQGAEALATREIWPNQAFRVGRAIGLQFHPEATAPIMAEWLRQAPQMFDYEGAQDRATLEARFAEHQPSAQAWLRRLLDGMFGFA